MDDEKGELETQLRRMKDRSTNKERTWEIALNELRASAEKDKEEIEQLTKEIEEKRTQTSQMVSTREMTEEREKRRAAEIEARKKPEEAKREAARKNDMAASRTKTLEKEIARMTRESEFQRVKIEEQIKK